MVVSQVTDEEYLAAIQELAAAKEHRSFVLSLLREADDRENDAYKALDHINAKIAAETRKVRAL